MKVAHIISSLTTGGAETLVAELSKIYSKKGIETIVISILDIKGIPYNTLKKFNIKIIELGYKNVLNPKIALDIYKYTKDCDFVHTHTTYAQLYSAFFLPKKKLITTEHSTNNRRRNKKIFKIIDYFMYKKYKKIICISEAVKESLNNWLKSTKEKSIIVNNGINLEKYENAKKIKKSDFKIKEEDIMLVNVARFSEAKNHLKLIEAMQYTKKDIHLFLIGDGELKDEIKKKINELNLNNRVHFLGLRDDVERILKTADIFILTSIYEGFGLAAIEARAAGLPIIISDVPGLTNLFEEREYILKINPNYSKDITEKINYLANNLKKINIKKDDLSVYSIETMAKKYLEEYERQ